jgi:hypothetical protein
MLIQPSINFLTASKAGTRPSIDTGLRQRDDKGQAMLAARTVST